MAAPQAVRKLVEKYEAGERDARGADGQRKLVQALLGALAWEIRPAGDLPGQIVPEHVLQTVADDRKPPHYSLRLGGVRKCFVGITSSLPELHTDATSAIQLRRFAWSANLPASILTNFEELSVYTGRVRPRADDRLDAGRIQHFSYGEYDKRWDELTGLLSPDAIARGELDRAADVGETEPVDEAFLDELETWRRRLAQNVEKRNPGLSLPDLNSTVQILIDRIVFLRICEDRGIEVYGQLRTLQERPDVYRGLLNRFRLANSKYNAGLFGFGSDTTRATGDLPAKLTVDDTVLRDMFQALYFPRSPYEFTVISSDILGQVYERFLGNEIVRDPKGGIAVEQKPDVRKSGGVYYTPSWVVNEIVNKTLGKLCAGKTPEEVAEIRVLDPSCGSGSFLTAAYQYLLDWHRDYYIAKGGAKQHPKRIRANGELAFQERKRILTNSIFGVDIDSQAIEISKLSLLLKVLEPEGHGMKRTQLALVHELPLPNLQHNIVCGNSLLAPDFSDGAQQLASEERAKFLPFDYECVFPSVFAPGRAGFDVVIGNPPYLSYSGRQSVGLPEPVRSYFKKRYLACKWPAAHSLFVERSVEMLSRGYVAFIVPDQIGHLQRYGPLRSVILRKAGLVEVKYWGEKVFKGVTTPALTFIADKNYRGPTAIVDEAGVVQQGQLVGDMPWHISQYEEILIKVRHSSFSLGELVKDCGIRTSDAPGQVIPVAERTGKDVLVLEGKCVDRYRCRPPTNAVRMKTSQDDEKYTAARFLIRQTADRPIVGPHEHANCFRNSVLALYAPEAWPEVEYIVGILNSRLMRFVYRETIRESRQKAFTQVKINSLRSLPIRQLSPNVPEEKAFHDEIVHNVVELLGLHQALQGASASSSEGLQAQQDLIDDRIERLVFRLYGLSKEDVRIVNRELGHDRANTEGTITRTEEKSSDVLWMLLDQGPEHDDWHACLGELVEREDPGVAPYVAEMLQSMNLPPHARSALVFAAERSQSFEPDVRRPLKDGLLSAAITMRDLGEQAALWAAIRRYATLVPVEEVNGLLDFLREEDPITTKQVTLQAIQNIFAVEVPTACGAVAAVRARVLALSTQTIVPSSFERPEEASLALEALCAAIALRDPQARNLRNKFERLAGPYLLTQVSEFQRSLVPNIQKESQ